MAEDWATPPWEIEEHLSAQWHDRWATRRNEIIKKDERDAKRKH